MTRFNQACALLVFTLVFALGANNALACPGGKQAASRKTASTKAVRKSGKVSKRTISSRRNSVAKSGTWSDTYEDFGRPELEWVNSTSNPSDLER